MLQFTNLDKDVEIIKEYVKNSPIEFCDISVGVKYMWRDEFRIEYSIFDETLIMKESCQDYENAFYYPIGKNVLGALEEIEKYCIFKNIPLKFCCIDNEHAILLAERYALTEINNLREWSDYIYKAEQFYNYSGKKLSGQRNHVNKFKKSYSNYSFKPIKKENLKDIKLFLERYNQNKVFSVWSEKEDSQKTLDLIENIENLGQVGGYLEVEGKIIGVSVGEVIKDTLIVHVEKALTEYQGVYPMLASEFAKAYAVDGVKYINREEDCGDVGLRISKLQYRPCEIKQKNIVSVKTLFDKIVSPIIFTTERLTCSDILYEEKLQYKKLYMDEKLNRYWGYDYKTDIKNTQRDDVFYNFQKALKESKEEYSLAVRKDGNMIGELVLHNCDYFLGVEIGFRFFKEYQGRGYAIESVNSLIEYLKNVLKAKTVKGKCYIENNASLKLFEKAGFTKYKKDEKYYYFIKNI